MAAKGTRNVTNDDPEEEPQDISLEAYLACDDSQVVGKVKTRHGMLAIAALTDDEADDIRRKSEKPDPRKGRGAVKLDDQLYKRLLVAKSLSKATPSVHEGAVLQSLATKLAGEITTIATAVIELSGFDSQELDRLGGTSA